MSLPATNHICLAGTFTHDNFKVYDRQNNYLETPKQIIRQIDGTDEGSNGFVVKYGPNGGLRWTAQMSGHSTEQGFATALDPSSNVYVSGYFQDVSLNVYEGKKTYDAPEPYVSHTISNPDADISNSFLVKYDTSGNYQWGLCTGSNTAQGGTKKLTSIATQDNQNFYYTTCFDGTSTQLYNQAGGIAVDIFHEEAASKQNVLLARYGSDGAVDWVARVEGISNDIIRNNITVDSEGSVYLQMVYKNVIVSGNYIRVFNGDPNSEITSLQINANGNCPVEGGDGLKAVIVKFNSVGEYIWTLQMPTPLYWGSMRLAIDADLNVYITGNLDGPDTVQFYDSVYSGGQGSTQLQVYDLQSRIGYYTMYVAKYSPNGSVVQCQWVNLIAGDSYLKPESNADYPPYLGGYGIAVDASGNSYTTGYFNDKFVTYDRYQRTYSYYPHTDPLVTLTSHRVPELSTGGGTRQYVEQNGFVASYDTNGVFRWVVQLFNAEVRGCDVSVDSAGQVVVGGFFGHYRQSLIVGAPIRAPNGLVKNLQQVNQGAYIMRIVGTPTSYNDYNYFVLKLNKQGNIIWGTQMGTTNINNLNYSLCDIDTN